MKDRPGLCAVWVAALIASAPGGPVRAHDRPPEVLAYVKVEGARLRVLVRVPIAFLPDARIPVRDDGYLDLQALDADPSILAAVASEVSRNLDVMERDRALQPLPPSWRIAEEPDASFETYDGALAQLVSPRPAPDRRIDPGALAVDVELAYPIAFPEGPFSLRVNGLRLATRASGMQTRFVTESGDVRTFVTSGEPRRVTLNPGTRAVGAQFARLGIGQLALGGLHLLFVFCLAIPRRPLSAALVVFAPFAAGCGFALVVSGLLLGSQSSPSAAVLQSLAGAVLVVAALQNITRPQLVWVRAVAAAFGVADGLLIGLAYGAAAPLAGDHELVAVVAFGAPLILGALWLLLLAHPIVGLVHRSRLPERWAIVLLSAIPIHAGLHGLLVGQ